MDTQRVCLYICSNNTVEPLNKGHVGASHFVLCREVVRSTEVQNVLRIRENEHLRL